MEKSEIMTFFKDSTIFLTGGTGYLGKLFIEKLLRTCYDLKSIYLLVRPKKGIDVNKRFEEILKEPSFEVLHSLHPNFISKLHIVEGDCCLPNLGLNESDQKKLISEVDCVIHCAATVRFTEDLRTAANINVRSVKDIINLCKQMSHLKAVLYISTAFSNCVRKQIDEIFYDPPISSERLFSLLEAVDDDQLEKITPILLGDYPNTYVFTKAIAESVVKTEGKSLPIAVYRPSVVIATAKEPIPGWIDNIYGPTGVMLNGLLGVSHSLRGKPENIAEIVPADYVINAALATLWRIGTSSSGKVPIYNFVSSADSPLPWGKFISMAKKYGNIIPTSLMIWHNFFKMRSNAFTHFLVVFLSHTLPAYCIDIVLFCIGRKPYLVKSYQKLDRLVEVFTYFTLREWKFSNNNVKDIWSDMSEIDKELFHFEMKSFDWVEYFKTYVKGARIYLLKDPMETVNVGKRKYYQFLFAHYFILTGFTYLLCKNLFL